MNIINVAQGSPEWLEIRSRHLCASDAPAMMGVSKYKTRADLIREKAIGAQAEVSAEKQRIFNRGHESEAAIRPHVEELIGEELYPVTAAAEVEGLSLLASFDGLTLEETVGFEHKLVNGYNADEVAQGNVPEEHIWQLEHQLLVSGAEKIIFVVSDGTPDSMRHCIYRPDPERRKRLLAGWKQFIEDVRNYQHVEVAAAPEGRSPESLPALNIEVRGMVAASNLDEFRSTAMAVIGSVNTALETDQDFADAEKSVKWCKDVEDRLDAAKQHALSQTADIDRLFRTIDEIKDEARAKRLELDKLVKARKESIRAEIVAQGQTEVANYCAALDNSVGYSVPRPTVNFADAVKGKKLFSAMRDAVSDMLAKGKIEANEMADSMRENLAAFSEVANDHRFLFPDLPLLVTKRRDDFLVAVKFRIVEHKEKQEAKEREEQERKDTEQRRAKEEAERREREQQERLAQAERDCIAAEEREAKAKAEADQRAEAAAREAEERVRRETEAKAAQEKTEAEKREKNKRHRTKIHKEAAQALLALAVEAPLACEEVIEAIAAGKVPHVEIRY